MKADLHCHTTFSDGSFSPLELLTLAKQRGLGGLSITDHDTLEAYRTAPQLAKELGIRLGSGVEFSCQHEGFSLHLLGYDYILFDPAIQELCQKHQKRRAERNRAILEKLTQKNMPLTEAELYSFAGAGTIGRPHIAALMVKKGYVSSIKQAFLSYLGDGKSCYVPGTNFSALETIEVIHAAGGKAFVAHPHLLGKEIPLEKIWTLPLDGLECYYALFPPEKALPWLKIAKAKNWLISGGSDFHGQTTPKVSLGASTVDEQLFNQIFSRPLS